MDQSQGTPFSKKKGVETNRTENVGLSILSPILFAVLRSRHNLGSLLLRRMADKLKISRHLQWKPVIQGRRNS